MQIVWFSLVLVLFLARPSSSGWSSLPSKISTLGKSSWKSIPSVIAKSIKKHGLNPTFQVDSSQVIRSPLLSWSDTRSWIKFTYELSEENPSIEFQKEIMCYRDLQGRFLVKVKSPDSVELKDESDLKMKETRCRRIINVASSQWYPYRCKTFRVKATFKVTSGTINISNIKFGSESLCSGRKPTTLACNFEDGDCGLQNDACGLVDWEIRSDSETSSRRDRSTHCYEDRGTSLLKKEIRDACSFENLKITKLQRSGFIQLNNNKTIDAVKSILSFFRGRRSSGYSLYLDPSLVTGVAVGILDLPEVGHADANAYLTFAHDMIEGGLHDLLVTAVCTSDPANSLIPLDVGSVHYHKSNLDGTGSSGTICLAIHEYVKCSTFVIQLQAAAIETVIIVDDIYFAENLESMSCNEVQNSRK